MRPTRSSSTSTTANARADRDERSLPASNLLARVLLTPAFPILIFLVFLFLATGLRHGLIEQDNSQITANLANEARAMANTLEREFTVHAQAIERMAKRLETSPDTSEATWRQDARQYLDHFGVYQAIEWIDRDFIIRWLEPISGNEDVIGNSRIKSNPEPSGKPTSTLTADGIYTRK